MATSCRFQANSRRFELIPPLCPSQTRRRPHPPCPDHNSASHCFSLSLVTSPLFRELSIRGWTGRGLQCSQRIPVLAALQAHPVHDEEEAEHDGEVSGNLERGQGCIESEADGPETNFGLPLPHIAHQPHLDMKTIIQHRRAANTLAAAKTLCSVQACAASAPLPCPHCACLCLLSG
jgi:hypothetical protein